MSSSSLDNVKWAALAVLMLLVLAVFLRNLGFGMFDMFSENKCKAQVQAHDLKLSASGMTDRLPGGVTISEYLASEIKCPTKYKEVKGDFREAIKDDMLHCWDTWGKGKSKLFPAEEGVFCHVCSVMEFDEETVIDDMSEYLMQDSDYLEKFAEGLEFSTAGVESIGKKWEESNPGNIPAIDTATRHAVIYKHVKGKDKIIGDNQVTGEVQSETLKQHLFSTAGGNTGFFAGAVFCSLPAVGQATCAVGATTAVVAGGLGGWFMAAEETETLAYIAVVPYTEEGIRELGCEVAPSEQ